MNQLTNFICVGAQKSGTTTLHDILNQHAEICLPNDKETKFFQRDDRFNKGLEYYKKHFSVNLSHKIIGEIDPEYMYFNYVPKRIYDTLGSETKLIFLLRNPIERAFSHFLMSKKRGYEDLSFSDAISVESERILKDDSQSDFSISNHLNFSYLDRGFYSTQIKNYLKYFNKENMLFVLFEDELIADRQTTIRKILSFLNVSTNFDGSLYIKSNIKERYRIKIVAQALGKHNLVKSIIKPIIPKVFRKHLKSLLVNLNTTKNNVESLESQKKIKYLNKYFKSEIIHLEDIIEKKTNWI